MVIEDVEFTCLLCNEAYEDPVLGECGHSFCRGCMDRAGASQDSLSCPDCNHVITEKTSIIDLTEDEDMEDTTASAATLPMGICPEHYENLKLYCRDDGAVCCIICRDSLTHNGHKFLAVVDAVKVFKEELSNVVSPLEESLTKIDELSNQQCEKKELLKNTMAECQQHITSEYGNLYNFLKERKEKLLEQLHEQSQSLRKEMESNAARMEKKSSSIIKNVALANQKVAETDSGVFLDGLKGLLKKCQELKKSRLAVTEKELCRGTFRGPIQYIAWKQMKSVVPAEQKPRGRGRSDYSPVLSDSDSGSHVKAPASRRRSGRPEDLGHTEIWLVGNGYLTAANRVAEMGSLGLNLGFPKQSCTVRWFGLEKFCRDLFLRLKKASQSLRTPDVLFFHSGSDYLERAEFDCLISNVRTELTKTAEQFPDTQFILSALYPKMSWRESPVDQSRDRLYSCLASLAKRPHFRVLRHQDLERKLAARCSDSDVNILRRSEAGMFLANIRKALQDAESKRFNPVREKFVELSSVESRHRKSQSSSRRPDHNMAERKADSGLSRFKEIWIVGNGLMDFARRRAQSGPLGLNLGFDKRTCTVVWKNLSNTWFQLFPKLKPKSRKERPPDAILFHYGSHDMARMSIKPLMTTVQSCLNATSSFYPATEIILSTLIPKPGQWLTDHEQHRKEFNSFLARCAQRPRFHVLKHYDLEKILTERFSEGFLSQHTEAEIDLFLAEVRDDLAKTILRGHKFSDERSLPSEDISSEEEDEESDSEDESMEPHQPSTRKRGEAAATSSKEIWIVGSEVIEAANSRSENLGLDKQTCAVHWWSVTEPVFNLFPKLKHLSNYYKTPDFIVFYTGNLDLENLEFSVFKQKFKACFRDVEKFYPKAEFIISTLLPKPKWLGTAAERRLKKFNSFLVAFVERPRFHLLKLDGLEKLIDSRHTPGGGASQRHAHTDLLIARIREALHKAMLKDGKPSDVSSETLSSGEGPNEKAQHRSSVTEQSDSEMEDNPIARERNDIWIMGDSYIRGASEAAGKGGFGENLGFDERLWSVRWMDKIDWRIVLINNMHKLSKCMGTPSIVYLHMGSNDLGVSRCQALIENLARDINQLARRFPDTHFIISTILPRLEWLYSPLEENRQKVNRALCDNAEECDFLVAKNEELEKALLKKFQKGQICGTLNHQENETFLTSIKSSIERVMMKDGEPVIACQKLYEEAPSTPETLNDDPENGPTDSTEEYKAVEEKNSSFAPFHGRIKKRAIEKDETIGVRQIWIVGNSDVCKAARLANRSSHGCNFGFEEGKWTVLWMGHIGMRWEALLPELNNALSTLGVPSIVFIHLGDDDVESVAGDTLMESMEGDLSQISAQFPNTEFVLSTILPRAEWLTNGVEEQRQEINATLAGYAEKHGFHVAAHEDIEEATIPRFKSGDSGSISDSEYDLFLKGIKYAIEVMTQKVESD